MKNKWLALLSLYCFPLFADSTHIHADHIRYQDHHLSLDGHVHIRHPMALLEAGHALIETKSQEIVKAVASKEVQLLFSNQSTLQCDLATLDFHSLQGSMVGKEVFFRDPSHIYQNHPLIIRGTKMDFLLKESLKSTSYDLSRLWIHEGIRIHYSEDYFLSGDLGEYRQGDQKQHDIIEIQAKAPYGCHIVHEKQQIDCDEILLEIEKALLHIRHAKGHFIHPAFTEPLYFEADELSYDDQHHLCKLSKGAYIQDDQWGEIHSEGIVELLRTPFQTKFSFDQMDTEGKVIFTFDQSPERQRLECYGTSHLDKHLGVFTAEKPRYAILPFSNFRQNIYERGPIKILCDELSMEVEEKNSRLVPTMVQFSGHVQVTSQQDLLFDKVFCDILTYDLTSDVMTLLANEGNAISFHKASKEMVLYAEKVQILDKKVIKAFGKAEFILSIEEKDVIKKALKNPPR